MNANPTVLDACLARTAAIHAKLERLRNLADNHFGHDPDAIHWGHVGDLGRVEAGLDELLAIFGGDERRRLPITGDDHDHPSQTYRHPDRHPQDCRWPARWQY